MQGYTLAWLVCSMYPDPSWGPLAVSQCLSSKDSFTLGCTIHGKVSKNSWTLPFQPRWWKHCHQLLQVSWVPAREYKTPDLGEGLNEGQEIDILYGGCAKCSGRWQPSGDHALTSYYQIPAPKLPLLPYKLKKEGEGHIRLVTRSWHKFMVSQWETQAKWPSVKIISKPSKLSRSCKTNNLPFLSFYLSYLSFLGKLFRMSLVIFSRIQEKSDLCFSGISSHHSCPWAAHKLFALSNPLRSFHTHTFIITYFSP